jgi:hypothetical protein
MYTALLILGIIWVAGQLLPWIQWRSNGLSLSFMEYCSPFIKKSIFGYNHNKTVFEALQAIQHNKLDISFQEIAEMYNANVDFQNVVDASIMIKTKGIRVSKEDLKELAYNSKDLMAIVSAKKPGEELLFADVFNKKAILYK